MLGSHDGNVTLLKRQYQYDAVGQLPDIHDTRRGHLAYQYDPVGRPLQTTSSLGAENYAFDPAGNLLDEKTQEFNSPLESDPRRNKHDGHVEASIIKRYAEKNNILVQEIAASTPICVNCEETIMGYGAKPVSPLRRRRA